MALNFADSPKKSKVNYPRIGEGTYGVRIVRLLDFGVQYETDFKTGEVKTYDDGNQITKHKVWIDFEFVTETIDVDGVQKPRWLGREIAVSTHEKSTLTALLKAADPGLKATMKGRNVAGLLGLPLMVTVGSTSTGKDKITGFSSLVKGMTVDPLANPTLFFDLDGNDRKTFESLPDWMKKRIQEGIDYLDTPFAKSASSFHDIQDDLPEPEESPY